MCKLRRYDLLALKEELRRVIPCEVYEDTFMGETRSLQSLAKAASIILSKYNSTEEDIEVVLEVKGQEQEKRYNILFHFKGFWAYLSGTISEVWLYSEGIERAIQGIAEMFSLNEEDAREVFFKGVERVEDILQKGEIELEAPVNKALIVTHLGCKLEDNTLRKSISFRYPLRGGDNVEKILMDITSATQRLSKEFERSLWKFLIEGIEESKGFRQ